MAARIRTTNKQILAELERTFLCVLSTVENADPGVLGGWKIGLLINFHVPVIKQGIKRLVLGFIE